MKNKLLLTLLLCFGSANAATYYVDKPFPTPAAKPCLIVISPDLVLNANAIVRVEYGKWQGDLGTQFIYFTGSRLVQGNQVQNFVDQLKKCP